jgi:hypothetical protein
MGRGRLSVLNLLFVLIVITVVALQHSAAIFAPGENAIELANYVPVQLRDESKTGLDYLGDLWQRAMILKQWMVEYQLTSWETMLAPRGAESELLEARFHVANAEAYGSATGDMQKAQNELDRADRYLQKALPLVADKMQPALNAIRKELSNAKMDLSMAEPDAASDEQIKVDLDWVIGSLHDKRL